MMPSGVTALILCLGAASRMRPLSSGTPKAFLPFCSRPLVEYTLELLRHHRIGNIVLVVGPEDVTSDRFRGWGRGINTQVVRRSLELGSAGVVRSVVNELRSEGIASADELIVIYGDSLLSLDFTGMWSAHQAYRTRGGLLTVACHQPPDLVVPGRATTDYGILSLDRECRIVKFREKPPVGAVGAGSCASAGVFLMDQRALDLFPSRCPADLSRYVLAPLASGLSSPVFGFDIGPGYRFDVGTLCNYVGLQFEVLRGHLLLEGVPEPFTEARPPSFSRCSIQGAALIGDGCAIADSVILSGVNIIEQGVVISEGTRIRDSILLDHAWIGAGVKIDGVVVGPSARIEGGSYLGKGTVVGGWSTVNTRGDGRDN